MPKKWLIFNQPPKSWREKVAAFLKKFLSGGWRH